MILRSSLPNLTTGASLSQSSSSLSECGNDSMVSTSHSSALDIVKDPVRKKSSNQSFDITGHGSEFQKYCMKNPQAKCIVGANGYWYDVSSFRYHHPGGSLLLEKCHGKDATELVRSFHERDVLKGWRPVGRYESSLGLDDPAAKAFKALRQEFLEMGFFKTSAAWYIKKFLITFILLLCSISIIFYFNKSLSVCKCIIAGLFLGLFWQQCGFLMHDLMHNEMTHNRHIDQMAGMFFGSFCLGISSHWWRDEHFEHHAFTNVIDKKTLYVDPQMQEEVWAQSPLLFPLYYNRGHWMLDWIQTQLVTFQHILWMPFCVIAGRLAICINAVFCERRWYEILSLLLHNILMASFLITYIPTWKLRMIYYTSAGIYEGVLHVQLLVSHYAKPWTEMDRLLTTVDWFRLQVYCNINIVNPEWWDWFHGGLNFHIEHHLFPTMPRHRFREASGRVRQVCQELGIVYDECSFSEALIRTLINLREIGSLYKSSLKERKKFYVSRLLGRNFPFKCCIAGAGLLIFVISEILEREETMWCILLFVSSLAFVLCLT